MAMVCLVEQLTVFPLSVLLWVQDDQELILNSYWGTLPTESGLALTLLLN